MADQIRFQPSPKGLQRILFRTPIWFYRLGFGDLMGNHFLLLTHRGRKSGKLRQNVLEVLKHDEAMGAYVVASGWGKDAQWFQNIMAYPIVGIQSKSQRMVARATRLSTEQAVAIITPYIEQHALSFRLMTRMMLGEELSPDLAGSTRLAMHMPLVALVYRPGNVDLTTTLRWL